MTDNGACRKSHSFRDACAELGLKHIRTKLYTPKTNGKAERFIQTSLREWAYAQLHDSRPPRRRTARLAASLQLASPARRTKLRYAHQPTRPASGQPVESPQLGLSGDEERRQQPRSP